MGQESFSVYQKGSHTDLMCKFDLPYVTENRLCKRNGKVNTRNSVVSLSQPYIIIWLDE